MVNIRLPPSNNVSNICVCGTNRKPKATDRTEQHGTPVIIETCRLPRLLESDTCLKAENIIIIINCLIYRLHSMIKIKHPFCVHSIHAVLRPYIHRSVKILDECSALLKAII